MPRAAPIFTTFNAGEWTPHLWGRVDLQKYPNACRTLVNFLPLPQGAAQRRPGTRFVAETAANGVARLIPFEFSTAQAYAIEAGSLYFRFYRDGGRIESPPGTSIEVATPYSASQINGLKWAQSADVLYLCHSAHAPRKLSRTSHTNWTFSVLSQTDGPYLDSNVDAAKTLQASATTVGSSITLTAAGHSPFASTDVGRHVRLRVGGTWGWVKITAFGSSTSVTATVMSVLGGVTATSEWRLGAWSDTTGWPTCVTFHEERLFLAGNASQPQTFWASVSGDYENFAPSTVAGQVTADSALTFTISDDRVNAVRWLSAGRVLSVGTSGGEFAVQASTLNESLTPDNIAVRRETTVGSADETAVRVGNAVLYVQRVRRKLFEIAYAPEADAFVSPEMTILARHLVRGGIRHIAFQQEPWSILWACLDDGNLVGLTYLKEQQVIGWHRHVIGGTNVKVLSLTTIPGDGYDELWLVVERTIGGAAKRYVERMAPEFWPDSESDKSGCFFVDGGLSYSGPPATLISGLDHLKGETVQILADGASHPDKTVDDLGRITLDRPASAVQVGLGYESRLETLDLEAGAAEGTAQGRRKRIHEVAVKLWATLGARIGFSGSVLDEISFREGAMRMDVSPPLFTGDKILAFPKGWDREARVTVVQGQPFPCTILAIMPRLTTNDT